MLNSAFRRSCSRYRFHEPDKTERVEKKKKKKKELTWKKVNDV